MISDHLSATLGTQDAARLSTAYEAILLSLSGGQRERMPDGATRLTIVQAMLAEGRLNGFDTQSLTTAGFAAASSLFGSSKPVTLHAWTIGAVSPAI